MATDFLKEKMLEILRPGNLVIDIGGGLRALPERGNRYDPSRNWALPLLKKVDYRILDPVSDYQPDIVGDIHNLPLGNDSVDGIICIAVLEHIENPFKAVEEIYRVLKPGGQAFIYTPFLFYYHAEKGYYSDYWRFTEDGLRLLFKNFSYLEFGPTEGALLTWFRLSPLGRFPLVKYAARKLDYFLGKEKTKNVSGYGIYLRK